MNEEAAVFDTALFVGLNTSVLPWTVKLSGPGLPEHSFKTKHWHLCPLAYIESLIILTLNGLLETKLWADIARGENSCKKRKTKQRDLWEADLVTYCTFNKQLLKFVWWHMTPSSGSDCTFCASQGQGPFNNYLHIYMNRQISKSMSAERTLRSTIQSIYTWALCHHSPKVIHAYILLANLLW